MAVSCRTMGTQVEICMEEKNDGKGLYRAWICGKGGRMELGTLTPEGTCLCLRRRFSLEKLKSMGCWPITDSGMTLAHAFCSCQPQSKRSPPAIPEGWIQEKNPEQRFPQDPLLFQAAEPIEYCLSQTLPHGFCLAIPFGSVFYFSTLFCFAQVKELSGKQYAIFSFSEEGIPQMPTERT
ncbi:MAG: hypothetical protein RR053_01990 [Evtepia sp.]